MIQLSNLGFYYKKSKPIFNAVSFEIKSGVYGLLGENGVGKTTLLHIMSGMRFPKEGKCEVLGYQSFSRNPNMLNQLYFLPEEFLASGGTINQFVKYNTVFYPNFSNEQLDGYLDEFQIDKEMKMKEVSLGQRKKAMIAFALALNTPILLLDEPTNGLDIPSKAQFRKIIASVTNEEKCIVISTHQVRDLENLIDPIIILDRNQILLNNSVEEITQKLLFTHTTNRPENALYAEQSIQGYSSVSINTEGEESVLDIEALFNTVVNNKSKIKELFNL